MQSAEASDAETDSEFELLEDESESDSIYADSFEEGSEVFSESRGLKRKRDVTEETNNNQSKTIKASNSYRELYNSVIQDITTFTEPHENKNALESSQLGI